MGTIFLYFSLFTITLGSTLPNFVVFLADDLGYGDLGCFGNDTISTPNIDQLALSGVKLNHHLTAAAVCTPSRAALLTGRYPIRSGMESSNRNKVFFFAGASGGLPEREITIASALKEKNYVTAMIGKWHLGNDCIKQGDGCHHPINHGFDSFFGLPLSNFKDMGDKGESVITSYVPNFYSYFSLIPILGLTTSVLIYKKHKCWSLFFMVILFVLPLLVIAFLKNLNVINGILMQDLKVVEQPLRLKGLTQRFVEKAKTFLSQQTSSQHPFFLYFSFVHVHTALFCSDDFEGKSKHGPYGDNVEELDWAVGEVMTTLKSSGLLNSTFVYFSSDNGAHIEEVGTDGHREGGSNGILRGGKTMGGFEGGIRVPTIISWPGFPIGEINFTTSQMDLFPTMMELAKIQVPQDRLMDGKSLVPLLQRKSNSPHTILFHYCGRKIHAATYIQNGGKNVWKVHWTTPKFTPGTNQCEYVCHCFGDFVEHHNPPLLFDLLLDPSESHPKKLNSDHFNIILEVERAREEHIAKVEVAPDQFSFENTVWKPWLQPCCNFPICKCTEL